MQKGYIFVIASYISYSGLIHSNAQASVGDSEVQIKSISCKRHGVQYLLFTAYPITSLSCRYQEDPGMLRILGDDSATDRLTDCAKNEHPRVAPAQRV